jgi:hypothetical protein
LVSKRHPAQQASKVSDRLLVAMAPNAEWNSVEGKEIIANADYLRQVMVRFLSQQTDEDREMAKTFQRLLGEIFKTGIPLRLRTIWKP